jgi:uncharacterized protein (TIGR02466 family)
MKDDNVFNIFPTPIYLTSLDNKSVNVFDKFTFNKQKNFGNYTSDNNFILNNKKFNKLNKEILKHVNYYLYNVLCYKDIKPYITQSWLNYTSKDEYHHIHSHANSLISGVLYIKAIKEIDSITFEKTYHNVISPNIEKYNLYNSPSWFFPVETNNLILFPSNLKHFVTTKNDTSERISLAFNIFVKGTLGMKKNLTYLKL